MIQTSTLIPRSLTPIDFYWERGGRLSLTLKGRLLDLGEGTNISIHLNKLFLPLFTCYRVCPGKDLAENTIWITIVSMFYAFKISSAIDKDGKQIPIDTQHSEHSVRYVFLLVIPIINHS